MNYLEIAEIIELHQRLIEQTGGMQSVRDHGLLDSALAQPRMAFGGVEQYPSIEEKAAALAFSLIRNHPFFDGNKRIGHAAMETFLILNGLEIEASTDEQEAVILGVAASRIDRSAFTQWLKQHSIPKK